MDYFDISHELVPNSDSKCLLENWFEERQTRHIDGDKPTCVYSFINGHKDIITKRGHKMQKETLYNVNYQDPGPQIGSTVGERTKHLDWQAFNEIWPKVFEETEFKLQPTDYTTSYKKGYHKTFPKEERKIKDCVLSREQPVTFWTEIADRATHMTERKTLDTPFRRNARFTTSVEDSYEQFN